MAASRRILNQMFVHEATLEFPDAEIATVTRMVQSATRAGRLPRDAAENWPIVAGSGGGGSRKAVPSKPAVRPSPKSSSGGSPSGDPSGRLVPAQSSLRSGDSAGGLSHTPPRGLRKFTKGSTGDASDNPSSSGESPAVKPSLLKRAYSKARGRDPENDLPVPKGAASKVSGGPTRAFPDLPDTPARLKGQSSEDEPLFRGLGLSGQETDSDDDDPAIATIKRGLSKAKPAADGQRVRKDAGETKPEEQPTQSGADGGKRQQGRLSRLFKGRRDDGI